MSKVRLTRNTPEEEAAIQRGIAVDPDNPEWTAKEITPALSPSSLRKNV
jgi:hypothetical protein